MHPRYAVLACKAHCKNGKRPVLLGCPQRPQGAAVRAAALLDFDIRWLWPSAQAESALCSCPVTAEALTGALHALAQQGIEPFGVYVTSPDYLGGVQDIPAMAAVCRAQGVPLLVDNAHGAHLHFLLQNCHPSRRARPCAMTLPTRLCRWSPAVRIRIWRTMPCRTAAVGRWHCSALPAPLTSFCSRWMPAMRYWQGTTPSGWQCCAVLESLRRSLNKAAAARQCPMPLAVAGAQQEPMKLTLDAAALGCTGTALAESLRRAQMECEYADPRYVVLMFTPENPPQDYTRLQTALEQSLQWLAAPPENRAGVCRPGATGGAALHHPAGGAGRTGARPGAQGTDGCAMPMVSCPPAIPVAVSGEEITPAAIALMQRYGH